MRHLKTYESFEKSDNTSRKTIHDLDDLVVINQGHLILIYNPFNRTPVGYIGFGTSKNDTYPIYSVYSDNGYGPLLYELVMTYVYPNGITLDDSSPTTDDALNVWKKFYNRNDIKKEPINRDEKTWKEKELINNCKGDNNCLKKVREILDLHDLSFSYNLGKSTLDELISKGDEYLKKNPDLDIEDMVNYLNEKYDR